jgi:hypothetical protein
MKPIVMASWSEIFGLVQDVQIFEERAVAQIGKISVIFPLEQEVELLSLEGTRVAILHTDIEGKEYLFRAIHEEKPDHDKESAADANALQAIATETKAHQRKVRGVL